MRQDGRENTKLAYEKPKLTVIELVAEEVLAAGCKTLKQSAPLNPITCVGRPCSQKGS